MISICSDGAGAVARASGRSRPHRAWSPALHLDYRSAARRRWSLPVSTTPSASIPTRGSSAGAGQPVAGLCWGWADQGAQSPRPLFGQQRPVPIARALVKHPPLLILDEPCRTDPNRHLVREMVAASSARGTQLLFGAHHADDVPPA